MKTIVFIRFLPKHNCLKFLLRILVFIIVDSCDLGNLCSVKKVLKGWRQYFSASAIISGRIEDSELTPNLKTAHVHLYFPVYRRENKNFTFLLSRTVGTRDGFDPTSRVDCQVMDDSFAAVLVGFLQIKTHPIHWYQFEIGLSTLKKPCRTP